MTEVFHFSNIMAVYLNMKCKLYSQSSFCLLFWDVRESSVSNLTLFIRDKAQKVLWPLDC
jgi:hypothetical protein